MSRITISYSGNSLSKDIPEGSTVGTILGDRNLQAVLGFGANVEAQLDGAALAPNAQLGDGDEISIVTKANSKA